MGVNKTSAVSTLIAGNVAELVKNPDYYSSADQWYAQPGSYISVYWDTDSAGGSSGGTIRFSGSLPWLVTTNDWAAILQPIKTPPSSILSASMSVRYRLAQAPFWLVVYYVFGVWDPSDGGGWAWLTYDTISTSSTYTSATFTVTNITGGKEYYVVGGVYVYTRIGGTIDYYIDYIQLTVETSDYTFANTVLDLNVTSDGPYYARLSLESLTAQPDLDCNITLLNWTAYESSPIIIRDGEPVTTQTSEVVLPQPPSQLYVSGSIDVSVVKSSSQLSELNLTLTYCTLPGGEGACVSYPITVVIDPPLNGTYYTVPINWLGTPSALSVRIDRDAAVPLTKGEDH